jgi:adenylate cyclase class 2
MENREIEVRFLEIDKDDLIKKLKVLGAEDRGDDLLREIIFYDKALTWRDVGQKLVKVRERRGKVTVTYKSHIEKTVDGTEEVEFGVSDAKKAELFLEKIGLIAYRHQEKRRHTFYYKKVTIDIDTWPRIPTYVELEGESEQDLKKVANELGFDWSKAVLDHPREVIEKVYKIPVGKMHWFTFDKFE